MIHHFKKTLCFVLLAGIGSFLPDHLSAQNKDLVAGAWQSRSGDTEQRFVFVDNYFTHSTFDKENKQFIRTRGGQYVISGNTLKVTYQFQSDDKTTAGKEKAYQFQADGDKLTLHLEEGTVSAVRLDANDAPLAGVWRISGRKEGDAVNPFPLGDRRTLKILTGTTFQWAAIHIKTGEFFGTGGGTYTFQNGKYTEHIEFFSRDNSRVGASLTFDGKIESGSWHHSGLSSAGQPIYEVWSRLSNANR